jgi:hypothetical protein
MIYYGSQSTIDYENHWAHPNGDEIVIMQQHCGGENLVVFKGFVKPDGIFHFYSLYFILINIYFRNIYIRISTSSRLSICISSLSKWSY